MLLRHEAAIRHECAKWRAPPDADEHYAHMSKPRHNTRNRRAVHSAWPWRKTARSMTPRAAKSSVSKIFRVEEW